jgi:TolB-like protein
MNTSVQQRFLAILFLSAVCLLMPSPAAIAREAKVLIYTFEANSNEDVSHIQSGIAALLPARVAVPKRIIIIDGDAQRYLQPHAGKPEPLSEKLAHAKKLGADYIVAGSITKLGSAISIDTKIADVQRSMETVPVGIQCTGLDSLIPEMSKLGLAIRRTIEENPAFSSYSPPEQAPPAAQRTAPVTTVAGSANLHETKNNSPAAQLKDTGMPANQARPDTVREERYISDPAPRGTRNQPGALFASVPITAEYIRSVPLNCLAAGDVNGDGVKELIAAGEDEIHLLRFDGRKLVPLEQIRARPGEHILHLDAANLTGASADEIYVTSYEGNSANSFIIEYKNNDYARIQENLPWFFRVVSRPEAAIRLIGQDAKLNNPFGGSVYQLVWDNGALASGAKYKIPGGTNIYGFTEAELGGDMKYLAFTGSVFSPEYSLHAMNAEGKILWKDQQSLGGTPNSFQKFLFANQTEVREPVPLRIICQTGSRSFVIVARNVKKGQKILKQLMNYNQGELLCLVWNGRDFEENWHGGYFRNHVADYILEDIDNDGTKELCILSSTGGGVADRAINKITVYRQTSF